MIDFDKLFEDYLRDYLSAHGELTADEAEAMIPGLYERFVTSPCAEAGGVTPEKYFESVTDPSELVKMFIESAETGGACSLLVERIMQVPECAGALTDVVRNESDPTLVVTAMDLLRDMEAAQPLETYATWISDSRIDEGIAEAATDILKENADAVKEMLFAKLSAASLHQKHVIADVLTCAERDERTYALLKDLFTEGENIPYIAALIARYGDERAAEYLYPALDDCNYHEFIEIRNAIESMGGIVDESYRDFSDDPFYQAIKHTK